MNNTIVHLRNFLPQLIGNYTEATNVCIWFFQSQAAILLNTIHRSHGTIPLNWISAASDLRMWIGCSGRCGRSVAPPRRTWRLSPSRGRWWRQTRPQPSTDDLICYPAQKTTQVKIWWRGRMYCMWRLFYAVFTCWTNCLVLQERMCLVLN